ncbi:MAG TPA: DUF4388 domain-containing protein [Candidatus Methylacidiphilales bacterium]|jgi:hypothetical protein|nr:DUF4388 domain-containing protein [Candidatus Methylacidiphilales bacterium]
MPLSGELSEFPLPEVLLLIGGRTGRLRLFDAPEFLPIEIDLSEGYAHGLHIGTTMLFEAAQIVAELSYAIETGNGRFEFTSQPIVSVPRDQPIAINELVMQLVLRVDEKLAKHRAVLAPELFYVLVAPVPTSELKGDLKLFFLQSRQLLSGGVRSQDLAEYLGIEDEVARLHLYHLHQLGLVRLIETTDVEALRETMVEQEIAEKTEDYQLAAEASDIIRRSGRLLRLPKAK